LRRDECPSRRPPFRRDGLELDGTSKFQRETLTLEGEQRAAKGAEHEGSFGLAVTKCLATRNSPLRRLTFCAIIAYERRHGEYQ
jgi:hypothetical protein